LSESVMLTEIEELKSENRRLLNVNNGLRRHNEQIKQDNKYLRRRTEVDEAMRVNALQASARHLNEARDQLAKELAAWRLKFADLEERYRTLEQRDEISQLIDILDKRLSVETVTQYDGLIRLVGKFRTIKLFTKMPKKRRKTKRDPVHGSILVDGQFVFKEIGG